MTRKIFEEGHAFLIYLSKDLKKYMIEAEAIMEDVALELDRKTIVILSQLQGIGKKVAAIADIKYVDLPAVHTFLYFFIYLKNNRILYNKVIYKYKRQHLLSLKMEKF